MTKTVAEPGLRKDAAHNRQLLIDAAEELFAERGLTVSLDDIARHAGVGVGTAYRRFANKQELITALFEKKISDVTAIARAAAECADPLTGLEEFLTKAFGMMAGNRGLRDIMVSANVDMSRKAEAGVELNAIMTTLLERAQADGQVRPELGPTDFGVIFWMIGATLDYTDADTEVWSRHLRIWLDGIRASAATTALPGHPLSADQFDYCSERAHTVLRGRGAR